MGINTVIATAVKFFFYGGLDPVARELVWFSFPVVVIMAPVGAFVASFMHRKMLALMVYVLTTVQFVSAYIVLDINTGLVVYSLSIFFGGVAMWSLAAHMGTPASVRHAKGSNANLR